MPTKKMKKVSPKAARKVAKKTAPMKTKTAKQSKKPVAKGKAAKMSAPKAKTSKLSKRGKPAAAKTKSAASGKTQARTKPARAKITPKRDAKAILRADILSRPLPQPENGPALETHAHATNNLMHPELIPGSETSKELSRRRIADEKSKHNQYPLEDKRALARQEHMNGSTPLRGL